jgi:hypothetical protein
VERLGRVRDLLATRGYDTRPTRLACFSVAGFAPDIAAGSGDDVVLVGSERLYS